MIQLAENKPLTDILASIHKKVPPLWPLKDYVAVNPFLGHSEQRFLSARQSLRRVRSCELLMDASYFRAAYESGAIDREQLSDALDQCQVEYPALYERITVDEILSELKNEAFANHKSTQKRAHDERLFHTLAEAIDTNSGTAWTSNIVDEVSRHCAAHYDAGQSIWQSPWKDLPLYQAWRESSQFNRKMEMLGIVGFNQFVSNLPVSPRVAVGYLLEYLEVPRDLWEEFLLCQLASVAGWASYVRYACENTSRPGELDDDLVGLLAIRLAYDGALASAGRMPEPTALWPDGQGSSEELDPPYRSSAEDSDCNPSMSVLARYAFQVAAEIAYRKPLCRAILDATPTASSLDSPTVQMVFCIDVRSELIRRHLESITPKIQTFGFAGFFGLALQYVPMGESAGSSQCPVLLKPSFTVREAIEETENVETKTALYRRKLVRAGRGVWQSFQQSATSCFTFVESLGWSYAASLVKSTLRQSRSANRFKFDGVSTCDHHRLGPALESDLLPLAKRIDLAAGMLKNLGMTESFAPLVVICGHESETVNNPYRAGLDCGACGGHSGETNARVAALLLNQSEVRRGLAERGIHIPTHVHFLAAVHNTTTDEIKFFGTDKVAGDTVDILAQLKLWTADAAQHCRIERSLRLSSASGDALLERARDWSEVRPEWGLAGNAAFVVAPRARTAGLKLDGRVFMHSYDHVRDHDSKVLELIMTAPMVVANWINLQYYASSVDNESYGSGNKVLHNVVGQFGVLQGNGGDLMTGLPWQSVHDGVRYQHEPLRLSVVIEAPRSKIDSIIEQHELVQQLVRNGWLTLLAIDNDQIFQHMADGEWREALESPSNQRNFAVSESTAEIAASVQEL